MLEVGKWHDRFPGETRAQLDLSRLISFYDSELFPSLRNSQLGKERWEHRVGNVTKAEREALMERIDEVLQDLDVADKGSGVDWISNFRVVIHRYAERLEVLQYMLNSTDSSTTQTTKMTLKDVHDYVSSMHATYILNGVRPSSGATGLTWATPVFKACAETHTKGIPVSRLTSSEKVLVKAVSEVLYEICRVTVGIWAEGVDMGLDRDEASSHPLQRVSEKWKESLDSLMVWLDWSVWAKCRPACHFEVCLST
ncbi:hypothetical protein CC1G_14467 [Coprinopsis cinerea okayama7|uniref:Uncharacterized protein n=1 Tax=Coprinopsis cinerea (strain Okayama-7 / 130 / ATCC MYA-4618 / FGSC 9003) TaxID=240176 RepID=D6RM46_COPC7|nr:hypothetical protein CC1G_14467 [Coprinopsis cinerea okayama7\|eukprot:XP_002911469.1 hypothetical protein CC1G_14467 [Coprinopsis cinerea okayama7\